MAPLVLLGVGSSLEAGAVLASCRAQPGRVRAAFDSLRRLPALRVAHRLEEQLGLLGVGEQVALAQRVDDAVPRLGEGVPLRRARLERRHLLLDAVLQVPLGAMLEQRDARVGEDLPK